MSYQPEALTIATARAMREATNPPTGPVFISVNANLFQQEGLEAEIGEGAGYQIEGPGAGTTSNNRSDRSKAWRL